MTTTLVVNGVAHVVESPAERPLLAVLRGELGITGPKLGCGEGRCGACVVRVGDECVPACRTALGEVGGRPVTTVEGLLRDGRLHPAQQAWLEVGAFQCGFCTPGWVVETAALIDRRPRPPEAEMLAALERHLCRCCAYPRIRRALRRAVELADGTASPGLTVTAEQVADRLVARVTPESPEIDGGPDDGDAFFAAVGDGIVSVLDPPARPGGGRQPTGAWVHVGAGGRVTAGIGKVEGGQGTRTALTLLIAEEIGVPPAAIRLVMGDTAVSPFDMGTFGSRSMPDAGPALRAAAAGAREALREMAAERLGVAPAALALHESAAVCSDPERSVTYADLLCGVRRTLLAGPSTELTPTARWRTAGRDVPQAGHLDAVLGTKLFPSDLSLPGMLHGAVLRAPAYGARLRSLDSRRAEAMAGVTVVRDGAGFAGVVAGDAASARRAAEALAATWDLTPQPARADLEAHLRSHPVDGEGWAGPVCEQRGDPGAAFGAAALRLTATYRTAYIAHVPLEPRAAVAEWRDGRLTVWAGTQTPFNVRRQIAEALDLDTGRVRVIVPDFGGGFGGKHAATVALEAARLARAAPGRPVRLQWSRTEEFTWGHLRPAAVIDVAAGLDAAGQLLAWSMTNVNSGPAALLTPYTVPHWRVRYQPSASPLPQGSYRALAATANHFARESHMDELARRTGADPLQFRLRHLDDARLREVFLAAAERAGWHRERPATPGYGRGIAGGIEKDGRVATAAELVVEPDRRVRLLRLVTAFDCGAIVNPDNLRNQVEGATVMGLGGALFEAIDFRNGHLLNASLADYRVPRLSDVPAVEVVLLDRRDQPPAGGGETPIVGVAPAIAGAIADACGVRLTEMPLIPGGTGTPHPLIPLTTTKNTEPSTTPGGPLSG